MTTDLSFADHFGKDRDDSPYWNESVWFSFSIPERRIHGIPPEVRRDVRR